MLSLKRMWELRAQVVVDAPPDQVFSYVTDFHRHHEWLPEDRETQKTSEGPVGVGTTFTRVNRRRLGPYQMDVVVAEFAPNERLAFEARPRSYFTRRFGEINRWGYSIRLEPEPVSGGTRVTVRREPIPLPWWGWPVLVLLLPVWLPYRPFYHRKMRAIGSRVKEYYETPAA
jgi:uncharacterized protein YndB with AHSA1/START domain